MNSNFHFVDSIIYYAPVNNIVHNNVRDNVHNNVHNNVCNYYSVPSFINNYYSVPSFINNYVPSFINNYVPSQINDYCPAPSQINNYCSVPSFINDHWCEIIGKTYHHPRVHSLTKIHQWRSILFCIERYCVDNFVTIAKISVNLSKNTVKLFTYDKNGVDLVSHEFIVSHPINYTGTRIFCTCCCRFYSRGWFARHLLTNKHVTSKKIFDSIPGASALLGCESCEIIH
jgi:hypothetical protein